MPKVDSIQPSTFLSPDFAPDKYLLHFLAQGDSWFSIGGFTSNLLMQLTLQRSAFAVNFATPGQVLSLMVDKVREGPFLQVLSGNQASRFHAILLSGGGNDLIEAIGSPPVDAQGRAIPIERRLLRTAAERGATVGSIDAYVSEPGWATFTTYLTAQFQAVIDARDAPRSQSKGVPVIAHEYDFVTPRDAGVGPKGPWLSPALQLYEVPTRDWNAVSDLFLGRLSALLHGLALPNLHIAKTQGSCERAAPGSTGRDHDWANEIHPIGKGYAKLAKPYAAQIDQVV